MAISFKESMKRHEIYLQVEINPLKLHCLFLKSFVNIKSLKSQDKSGGNDFNYIKSDIHLFKKLQNQNPVI